MKKPDAGRVVLPKWRRLNLYSPSAEFRSIPKSPEREVDLSLDLSSLRAEWEANPELPFATDLISASLATGDRATASSAAEFVLASPVAHPLAVSLARQVLGRVEDPTSASPDFGPGEREFAAAAIAELKAARTRNGANPFTWTELARQYASIGQGDKAWDAMRVALGLAGSNRYVIRSAARLLIHQGVPDEAHRLLLRATRDSKDPWLLASEIAVAQFGDRDPQGLTAARKLLGSDISDSHLTELASAVGTLELEAGRDRRARTLFARSIVDPNDNALAQAEWAKKRVRLDQLDEKLATQQESYEAQALAAAEDHRTADAVSFAFAWLRDEPYSLGPAMFGSYQAAKMMDFKGGEIFAVQGLAAHHDNAMLLNNLAFCQAKEGYVQDAEKTLARIQPSSLKDDEVSVIRATAGLIAMRKGRIEEGIADYRDAIRSTKDDRQRALALIMFASELLRAEIDESEQVIEEAEGKARELDSREAEDWLGHLNDQRG